MKQKIKLILAYCTVIPAIVGSIVFFILQSSPNMSSLGIWLHSDDMIAASVSFIEQNVIHTYSPSTDYTKLKISDIPFHTTNFGYSNNKQLRQLPGAGAEYVVQNTIGVIFQTFGGKDGFTISVNMSQGDCESVVGAIGGKYLVGMGEISKVAQNGLANATISNYNSRDEVRSSCKANAVNEITKVNFIVPNNKKR